MFEEDCMAGKTKFVVAGLLIVAAVAYLIVSSTGSTAHYFLTIEELGAMEGGAVGRNVTVSGAVLGDTIVYDSSVPRVTFTVVQVPGDPQEVERRGGLAAVLHAAVSDPAAPRLDVVYDDVKPDLLQHEAQAIMRGQLGEDGRFHADEVLLKCPTRYEEDVPAQTSANSAEPTGSA
jgi:cytochrome c-type biogenesis protein CcmE